MSYQNVFKMFTKIIIRKFDISDDRAPVVLLGLPWYDDNYLQLAGSAAFVPQGASHRTSRHSPSITTTTTSKRRLFDKLGCIPKNCKIQVDSEKLYIMLTMYKKVISSWFENLLLLQICSSKSWVSFSFVCCSYFKYFIYIHTYQ